MLSIRACFAAASPLKTWQRVYKGAVLAQYGLIIFRIDTGYLSCRPRPGGWSRGHRDGEAVHRRGIIPGDKLDDSRDNGGGFPTVRNRYLVAGIFAGIHIVNDFAGLRGRCLRSLRGGGSCGRGARRIRPGGSSAGRLFPAAGCRRQEQYHGRADTEYFLHDDFFDPFLTWLISIYIIKCGQSQANAIISVQIWGKGIRRSLCRRFSIGPDIWIWTGPSLWGF